MDFKHILVTTDFSSDSIKAFPLAAKEARRSSCSISLLAVVNDWDVPPILMQDIANPEAITKYRQELAKKAQEKLDQYTSEYFKDINVDAQVILAVKPVDQVITSFAKDNQCDLIIIASHGRGALGNFLLGSVVQKVIKHSPCPILIAPKDNERT